MSNIAYKLFKNVDSISFFEKDISVLNLKQIAIAYVDDRRIIYIMNLQLLKGILDSRNSSFSAKIWSCEIMQSSQ